MKKIKYFGKIILALLLCFLIFWTVCLGFLQTEIGQEWTFKQLIQTIEDKTNTRIQVKKIKFSFPLQIHLEHLCISQEDHLLLTAESADAVCSYLKLLEGRCIFSTLSAAGIDLYSFPSSLHDPNQTKETDLRESSFFPFYVKAEHIDMQRIRFMPSFLDPLSLSSTVRPLIERTYFNLQGMVSHNPFRRMSMLLQGNLVCSMKVMPAASIEESLLCTLIGKETTLKADFKVLSNQFIELNDVKFQTPDLFAGGSFIFTPSFAINHAAFKGTIRHLSRFKPWIGKTIEGDLFFDGDAVGSISNPSFVLNIKSPSLSIAERSLKNIHSHFNINPLADGMKGIANFSISYLDIPVQGSAAFQWIDQNKFILSDLNFDGLDSHLKGALSYSPDNFVWEGQLEAHTSRLSTLSTFLGVPMEGEAALKVDLKPAGADQNGHVFNLVLSANRFRWNTLQAQQFQLTMQGNPVNTENSAFQLFSQFQSENIKQNANQAGVLVFNGIHNVDTTQGLLSNRIEWKASLIASSKPIELTAEHSQGVIELKNPFDAPNGIIEFAFRNLQTPHIFLDDLEGKSTFLSSDNALFPFQLSGKGKQKESFLFNIEGNWKKESEKLEVTASRFSGQFGSYPFELKKPAHFLQEQENLQVDLLHLSWGKGEITGSLKLDDKTIETHFATNEMPIELLYSLHPEIPSIGKAAFEGEIIGLLEEPKGHFTLSLQGIQISDELLAHNPIIDGQIEIYTDGTGAQIKSELFGIGKSPVHLSGTIPFFLKLHPFSAAIDPHLPIDLTLKAEGELDTFLHFFSPIKTSLSGHTQIALQFTGQIDAPLMKGSVDLTNGSFESLSTGALFPSIEAHMEADGNEIRLTQFLAKDNKKGSISATGSLFVDPEKKFPFKFHIQPSDIFIIDADYATVFVSGALELAGNPQQSKLTGSLTVDDAMVRLEETLPRQIKSVEINYINVPQGEDTTALSKNHESSSPIELDVNLELPGKVLIQGHHLTTEWKGAIRVTGKADDPLLNGDLRIVDGQYDFNGKIFNLTQGNIHFAGSLGKKTTLYVIASKEIANLSPNYQSQNAYLDGRGSNPIDHLLAEIIVKGAVTQPVISFRSNPPLSQREILSYILFNRGISDITADQGDQLSQSFISLNSSDQTSNSTDFLSRLRNNIGIDRLDFASSNDENKDYSFQVGKYITENLYVSINKSINAATNRVAVEANLRKNVKVQAEVGDDSQVRTSIKWKKNY